MHVVPNEPQETMSDETPRRRESPWSDPRFVLPLVLQMIMVLVALVGSYLISERRTTVLETTAESMQDSVREIRNTVTSIDGSVRLVTAQTAEMRATIASQAQQLSDLKMQHAREIDQLRGQNQMLEARIIPLEKAISRAEGRAGVR